LIENTNIMRKKPDPLEGYVPKYEIVGDFRKLTDEGKKVYGEMSNALSLNLDLNKLYSKKEIRWLSNTYIEWASMQVINEIEEGIKKNRQSDNPSLAAEKEWLLLQSVLFDFEKLK